MLLGFLILCSCTSNQTSLYQDEKPKFDLSEYFSGVVDADGMFTDRNGVVKKRFTVFIHAHWENMNGQKVGTLDEHFEYSDGSKQERIWTITEQAPGKYVGKAADVVGEAIGESSGNALNWKYTLALPVDGAVYNVQFDDWMYMITPNVVLNKAKMSKFGIDLGEVTLSFYKRP